MKRSTKRIISLVSFLIVVGVVILEVFKVIPGFNSLYISCPAALVTGWYLDSWWK